MEASILLVLGDRQKRREERAPIISSWDKSLASCPEEWLTSVAEPGCAPNLVEQARTYPLTRPRQVLWVEEANQMSADDEALLLRYLERPAPFSLLVLSAESWDRRSAFFKALSQRGCTITYEPESPEASWQDFERWLLAQGISLDKDALRYLSRLAEFDPGLLAFVRSQLSLFAQAGECVSEEVVRNIAPESIPDDAFQMLEDFFRARKAEGIKRLASMGRKAERGIELIGAFHWWVRRMWLACRLAEEGCLDQDLPRRLGVSPARAKALAEQGRRIGKAALEKLLFQLREVDAELKASGPAAFDRLEVLLLNLR